MREDAVSTRVLTETSIDEMIRALALSPTQRIRQTIAWISGKAIQRLAFMYQLIRQMIAGTEVFGLTPRVTLGDLISADSKHTDDRQHLLPRITQSANSVLKAHMAHRLSQVASEGLRQV